MLKNIKQVLGRMFRRPTNEIEFANQRARILYSICTIVDTGQHDPWAHMSEVTDKLIGLIAGEKIEFKFHEHEPLTLFVKDGILEVEFLITDPLTIFTIHNFTAWVELHGLTKRKIALIKA